MELEVIFAFIGYLALIMFVASFDWSSISNSTYVDAHQYWTSGDLQLVLIPGTLVFVYKTVCLFCMSVKSLSLLAL